MGRRASKEERKGARERESDTEEKNRVEHKVYKYKCNCPKEK